MEMREEKKMISRRSLLRVSGLAAVTAGVSALSPIAAQKVLAGVLNRNGHRWGFLIDLNRCIGCRACAIACKTEFEVPLGVFRSSVKQLDEGAFPDVKRSFLPWLCNHCDKPICLEGCPVEEIEAVFEWADGTKQKYMKRATYKRPDGIVLVDQDRCVGCGACVELCPYKVRFLNPAKRTISEDAVDDHPADKCTLCVHRLDAGLVPACVNTCQANARMIGDLNDHDSEISKALRANDVKVLLPEKGTIPNCSYVALNQRTYAEGRDTR